MGEFLEAPAIAGELQDYLKGIRDLPRILGRLRNRLRNPARTRGLSATPSSSSPPFAKPSPPSTVPTSPKLAAKIEEFPELFDLLHRALAEDLPNQLQEGGYIADGYDADLDRIRSLTRDSKTWISDLEASEAARTGIKKLKIRFNNAFGYFIEVTKGQPPPCSRRLHPQANHR